MLPDDLARDEPTEGPDESAYRSPSIVAADIATVERDSASTLSDAVRPWGPWATLAWGLLCGGVFVATSSGAALIYVVLHVALEQAGAEWPPGFESGFESFLEGGIDGLFEALATIAIAPFCLATLWIAARFRGPNVATYLGLGPLPGATLRWIAVLVLYVVVADGLTWLAGRPLVPDFMWESYRTAGWLPLLLVALIVAAPLTEETFFRGFLFRGWAASRLGGWGTIVLVSALWAGIHVQYDLLGIASIFAAGLLLGAARWSTGSTTLTILLHAIMNAIATLQLLVAAAW